MPTPKDDNKLAEVLRRLEVVLVEHLPLPSNLTVQQAAKELNVSTDTIYEACEQEGLTHYRYGKGRGTIRIKRADLEAWQATRRVEARSDFALLREVGLVGSRKVG
jgi:excisionase family DNA binding protein